MLVIIITLLLVLCIFAVYIYKDIKSNKVTFKYKK